MKFRFVQMEQMEKRAWCQNCVAPWVWVSSFILRFQSWCIYWNPSAKYLVSENISTLQVFGKRRWSPYVKWCRDMWTDVNRIVCLLTAHFATSFAWHCIAHLGIHWALFGIQKDAPMRCASASSAMTRYLTDDPWKSVIVKWCGDGSKPWYPWWTSK